MNKNTSLYAPNPKKEPIKGTGFSDEKKAIETINIIKNLSNNHQVWIITTMYNRAKYHPYRTTNMLSAMKVFKSWLKKRLIGKATKYKFTSKNKIKKFIEKSQVKLTSKQSEIINRFISGKKIPLKLLLYRYDYIKKHINDKNKLLKVGYSK